MAKATKREMFEQIKGLEGVTPEIVDFVNHEIELLNRKKTSERKPTKTQVENEGFKQAILDVLAKAEKPMTISEIMQGEGLEGLKNQRVSALVTQLKKAGIVVRTEVKKVAYFALNKD